MSLEAANITKAKATNEWWGMCCRLLPDLNLEYTGIGMLGCVTGASAVPLGKFKLSAVAMVYLCKPCWCDLYHCEASRPRSMINAFVRLAGWVGCELQRTNKVYSLRNGLLVVFFVCLLS